MKKEDIKKGVLIYHKEDLVIMKVETLSRFNVGINSIYKGDLNYEVYSWKEILKDWDLLKVNWIPRNGQKYYYPQIGGSCLTPGDCICFDVWGLDGEPEYSEARLIQGFVFKTEKEAREMSKQLFQCAKNYKAK